MRAWAVPAAALLASLSSASTPTARVPGPAPGLRSVESFAFITDAAQRSAALFSEAGRVLTHPRCVNCHPATDRPRQGEDGRAHEPPVRRGDGGTGVAGLRCAACHTAANFDAAGVPGNPHWHLAPASMAWEKLSLRQICEQLKDPARNGKRKLEKVIEHMKSDPLVAWAWAPGTGREPAPGTQAAFGVLIEAWVRSGAACPAN